MRGPVDRATGWRKEDVRSPGGAITQTLPQRVRHLFPFLGETKVVFIPGMEWGPFVGSVDGLYENLKMSFEYFLFGET